MVINTTALEHDDRLRKEVGSLQALAFEVNILAIEYANRAAVSTVYDDVHAITLRLRSRRWFRRGRCIPVKILEMYLRFMLKVVATRPRVVWCHGLEMSGMIPALAILRACGWIQWVVWDQHELPSDALLASRVYRRLYAWLANRCDRIVMASQERRTLVLEWQGPLGVEIEVLENFADARFAQMPSEALPPAVSEWLGGVPYVLAQGGANPDRHLTSLVAAIVRNRSFKLVVVGPHTASQVQELEQVHGGILHQLVLFTGSLPQLSIPPFIDHAHASVVLYEMSSKNTTLCAPNRLYQAVARGVPVLVGSNPPMARIVDTGQCGVVLGDDGAGIDSLCAGLRALADTHVALRKMAGQRHEFNWESQLATIRRTIQPSRAA